MSKEIETKEKMYKMYGNYVQVPYQWYKLCRKYIIPKEVKEFTNKKENTIELNPMEINVLAYLSGFDECYITNNTLSEVFKVKKQTIEKYMKELRWVGFIKTFESKDNPMYTDRRDIHVQHNAIKAALENESNPYIVPYECKVRDEQRVPYECHASTLQMDGDYLTDVMQVPYICNTNKNKLEYIKINNKDVADAPNEFDFKSELSSLTNNTIKYAMDKKIDELILEEYPYEDSIKCLIKEFTGTFYKCDEKAVIQYADSKLIRAN